MLIRGNVPNGKSLNISVYFLTWQRVPSPWQSTCDGNSGIKIFTSSVLRPVLYCSPQKKQMCTTGEGGTVQRDGVGMDKSCQPLLQAEFSYHETVGAGNGCVEKIDSKFRKAHGSCVGTGWWFIRSVGRKERKWWDCTFLVQIGWSNRELDIWSVFIQFRWQEEF